MHILAYDAFIALVGSATAVATAVGPADGFVKVLIRCSFAVSDES